MFGSESCPASHEARRDVNGNIFSAQLHSHRLRMKVNGASCREGERGAGRSVDAGERGSRVHRGGNHHKYGKHQHDYSNRLS